jgi:hypothetical protein
MRKRVNGFFLVLIMVSIILVNSIAFPLVGLAGDMINGVVDIFEYSAGESAIYESDSFELTIVLYDSRITKNPDISNIKIRFATNSSFQVDGLPNPVNAELGTNKIDMLYTRVNNRCRLHSVNGELFFYSVLGACRIFESEHQQSLCFSRYKRYDATFVIITVAAVKVAHKIVRFLCIKLTLHSYH